MLPPNTTCITPAILLPRPFDLSSNVPFMNEQNKTFASVKQFVKTLAISLLLVGCGAIVAIGVMAYTHEKDKRIAAEQRLQEVQVTRTILREVTAHVEAEQEELKTLPLKR